MPKKLQITQIRSGVGRQAVQRRTLEALGLKRHQQTVVHDDTPQIRGMIEKVDYLLEVREVD
ncbi:MAG: 50S ribosomal protein L30 [Gemmatimonadetes bacterium]|nr:50S ribosomal protein L30 [Gemmatimonadota bacterium]NNM34256.1 50S ribosomal protein L30 [Gemmatimonadota bacterium]